jgi:hypothetical protein
MGEEDIGEGPIIGFAFYYCQIGKFNMYLIIKCTLTSQRMGVCIQKNQICRSTNNQVHVICKKHH